MYSFTGGHWTCTRRVDNGMWVFDDDRVDEVGDVNNPGVDSLILYKRSLDDAST